MRVVRINPNRAKKMYGVPTVCPQCNVGGSVRLMEHEETGDRCAICRCCNWRMDVSKPKHKPAKTFKIMPHHFPGHGEGKR